MTPRRGRPSLAERVAVSRRVEQARSRPPGSAVEGEGEGEGEGVGGGVEGADTVGGEVVVSGRHCWVLDPPGGGGSRPGLLIQWRRAESGWAGLVVFVADVGPGPVLLQGWVEAERLRQALG